MEPNGYQFPQIAISSGEKGGWPDGNAFGVVLSGERRLWPDGKRLNCVSSTETGIWPDGKRSESWSLAACVNKLATSRPTRLLKTTLYVGQNGIDREYTIK